MKGFGCVNGDVLGATNEFSRPFVLLTISAVVVPSHAALVTAGGKGSRIRELGVEKPLVPIAGVPMIDRILAELEDRSDWTGPTFRSALWLPGLGNILKGWTLS